MVDPTGLQEQLKRDSKVKYYRGKSFLSSALGTLLGSVFFLCLKGFKSIDSFPFLILSGVGTVALYLYFVDTDERNKKQRIFVILGSLAGFFVSIFFYLMMCLSKDGSGINAKNLFDAYFHNANLIGPFSYTLFIHVVGYFFVFIGIALVMLYLCISVSKYEKKHGKQVENYGYKSRKSKKRK